MPGHITGKSLSEALIFCRTWGEHVVLIENLRDFQQFSNFRARGLLGLAGLSFKEKCLSLAIRTIECIVLLFICILGTGLVVFLLSYGIAKSSEIYHGKT